MKINRYNSAVAACILLITAIAGCQSKPVTNEGPSGMKNLCALVMAYKQAAADRGRPPQSAADIEPYVKSLGGTEKLLISPRDGKPYVVRWGLDPRMSVGGTDQNASSSPVLAYEQEGRDGKRYVVNLLAIVKECTPEEFAALKIPTK